MKRWQNVQRGIHNDYYIDLGQPKSVAPGTGFQR